MTFEPGNSFVHRLHPLVKLAWLLTVSVIVFVLDEPAWPLIAAGCAAGLLWLAGVAPWRSPAVRVCLTLGLAIVALHALFNREGVALIGPITTGGLHAGLRAFGRLAAVILASTLFVTTTEPFSLACALMRAGLPYRWGFALVTALRLASVFRLEAHHVYQAQLARGVAYDACGLRRWWLVLRRLCLPLLVSALRMAQSLSWSMEGRAFGLHRQRTYLRPLAAGWRDAVAATLLLGVILAVGIGRVHGT